MVKQMQIISLWINEKDEILEYFSPNFQTGLTSIESTVEIAVHYLMVMYEMLSGNNLKK